MQFEDMCEPETLLVFDDTTIYEVDMNCYNCLSERERKNAHLDKSSAKRRRRGADIQKGNR